MTPSIPDMGGLEPFYGWYKLVMCNPKKTEHETTKSHFENFILLPLDNIDTGWRFSLSAFYFNSQID